MGSFYLLSYNTSDNQVEFTSYRRVKKGSKVAVFF